jgi:Yip1 domain
MEEAKVQPLAKEDSNTAKTGLSQWGRIYFLFFAPSKTFEDIRCGNRSWWLPIVLIALFTYAFFGTVAQKVGFDQVYENQMRMNSSMADIVNQMPAETRAKSQESGALNLKIGFALAPVGLLAKIALLSALLLGTINFGFDGRARYASVFAVICYAFLPSIVKYLLGNTILFLGMAPETFNIANFTPTNIAAFLDPAETNKALYSLAKSLDLITIWEGILLGCGVSIVAGVKRNSGYLAVFSWWILLVLCSVGIAAVRG